MDVDGMHGSPEFRDSSPTSAHAALPLPSRPTCSCRLFAFSGDRCFTWPRAPGSEASGAGTTGEPGNGSEAGAESSGGKPLSGSTIAAIIVATVASNIIGARYYRRMMVEQAKRSAERRDADRVFRAARERLRQFDGDARARQERARVDEEARERMRSAFGRGSRARAFGADDDPGQRRLDPQVIHRLETIGVENAHAGEEEVKAAFRKKALELHPDRNPNLGGARKETNEREFKRVAEAYAWLEEHHFRPRNQSER